MAADMFRTICSAVDKLDKSPWEEVGKYTYCVVECSIVWCDVVWCGVVCAVVECYVVMLCIVCPGAVHNVHCVWGCTVYGCFR